MTKDIGHEAATFGAAAHDWTTDPDATCLREVRNMLIEMRHEDRGPAPLHLRLAKIGATLLHRWRSDAEDRPEEAAG